MLKKNVILHISSVNNEFISGIFARHKKDDNKRLILNLKKFNNFVSYKHFKMESIDNVLDLIKPNAYMTSMDLKNGSMDLFGSYS